MALAKTTSENQRELSTVCTPHSARLARGGSATAAPPGPGARAAPSGPSYGPRCRAHVHRHRGRCHNLECAWPSSARGLCVESCHQPSFHRKIDFDIYHVRYQIIWRLRAMYWALRDRGGVVVAVLARLVPAPWCQGSCASGYDSKSSASSFGCRMSLYTVVMRDTVPGPHHVRLQLTACLLQSILWNTGAPRG